MPPDRRKPSLLERMGPRIPALNKPSTSLSAIDGEPLPRQQHYLPYKGTSPLSLSSGDEPLTKSSPPMSRCLTRSTRATEMQDYKEGTGDLLHRLPLASRIGAKVKPTTLMSQVKLETAPNQRPSLISRMTTKPLQPKNRDRPSTSDTSLGGQQLQSFEGGLTGISNSFFISSKSGPVTQPMSFAKSSYLQDVLSFLPTNGLISSRARLLTSPRFSGPIIPLKSSLNKATTLESSFSPQSSYLRSPRRLDPMRIGSSPSTR